MFKKILLVSVIGLGLVGCGDNDGALDSVDWKSKSTQEEIALIYAINGAKPNSCKVSRSSIKAAIANRVSKPSEDTRPFKDIEAVVKVEESTWKCSTRNTTMQEFYRQIHNKELFHLESNSEVIVKDDPTYTSSSDPNVVIVDNDKILSPKIIDEITEATTQCFSAKVKMVDIVEDKGYLTTEDYPEIMKLISKCKMNTLKNEIEKVN